MTVSVSDGLGVVTTLLITVYESDAMNDRYCDRVFETTIVLKVEMLFE